MNSGESNVQNVSETTLITSSPRNQPSDFFEATGPARGYNLRAGPVGSVWGLAPGRQGVQGASFGGPRVPSRPTLALSLGERELVEGPREGV
jgi:hypothetical protein